MITKLTRQQDLPNLNNLLLLADPSMKQINSYLKSGLCYIGFNDDITVGAYVLLQKTNTLAEIANIAVYPEFQGKGYGKALLLDAIENARSNGFTTIKICTGNSSINQLALYQKCGFRMAHIDCDYFVINYPEPIFENGIQCFDRIHLVLNLHHKETKHSKA